MLGPLPRLYRLAVSVAALLLCVAGGAWAALVLPYDNLVSAGASVGVALGVLSAYLLLRDPRGRTSHARGGPPRLSGPGGEGDLGSPGAGGRC